MEQDIISLESVNSGYLMNSSSQTGTFPTLDKHMSNKFFNGNETFYFFVEVNLLFIIN